MSTALLLPPSPAIRGELNTIPTAARALLDARGEVLADELAAWRGAQRYPAGSLHYVAAMDRARALAADAATLAQWAIEVASIGDPAPAIWRAPRPPSSQSPATRASDPAPVTEPEPEGTGEGARPPRDALAVLDGAGLWIAYTPNAAPVRADAPAPSPAVHAGVLLALARAQGVSQLWIHPTYARALGLPDELRTAEGRPLREIAHAWIDAAVADGWDIRPAALSYWLHAFQRGTYGAVDVVLPHLDYHATPWCEASDGRTLLHALRAFAGALDGWQYRRSPGATGTGLIRHLHQGNAASLNIEPPASLPDVARDGRGVSLDISWMRALTPEERARRYMHSYDKNGLYLGACSSLRLGFGEAEHRTAEGGPILFDARTPGYWHARVTWPRPALLPDPFTGAGSPDAPLWCMTPTLELAAELGATLDIDEAYTWAESHRALEPWYKRLRNARATLTHQSATYPERPGYALALVAIKQTYTQSIGWLNGGWLRNAEPADLYRPDWRHGVIAQAAANIYRTLVRMAAADRAPFAVHLDAVYIASDEPDPVKACPPELRLGDGLGMWKVKDAAVPLAELAPVLDGVGVGGRSLRGLLHLLTARDAGEDETSAGTGAREDH